MNFDLIIEFKRLTPEKSFNTIRSLLEQSKDRMPAKRQTGVVLDVTCDSCGKHISDTVRTLHKRLNIICV